MTASAAKDGMNPAIIPIIKHQIPSIVVLSNADRILAQPRPIAAIADADLAALRQ
jgi:hypothetical protein